MRYAQKSQGGQTHWNEKGECSIYNIMTVFRNENVIVIIKSLFNRTEGTHVISPAHLKMRRMRSPLIL
jgi:hypothetical protein